jgi:inner membrane protein
MSTQMIVWLSVGLLLIAAETMAPGLFMIWLGLAALVIFFIVWLIPGMSLLMQVVLFVFSFVMIGIYFQFFRGKETPSDKPFLNRRGEQLIDQVYPLETAIVNGHGRVKIGDAFWTVQGADMPVNGLVRVVAVDSMTLKVVPAE